MNEEFITPTPEHPVFTATCDYFGYIEESPYKRYAVETPDNCTHLGTTFATSFADAVTRLHEWIAEHPHIVRDYPKCKFTIECVNGSFTKYNELAYEVVYSITAKKAKRFLL